MGDDSFMRLALDLAARGLRAGHMPIGAVLVARGEVVAEAFWREGEAGGLLDHPESRVLAAADHFMDFRARREATLYTTLEPCLMCMGTAMSFFLGRVVFAMDSVADGASTVADAWAPTAGHPVGGGAYSVPEVTGGTCRDEARALIEEWLRSGATGPEARFARQILAPD